MMNILFGNPQFWIACSSAFVVALVIAYIAQGVWDTFWALKEEEYLEHSLSPINRPIEVGEKLYDTHKNVEVVYIGQSDNNKPLVVYQQDEVITILEATNIKNLRLIEE